MNRKKHLTKRKALELFGTVTNLAKVLGITKSAVSQWEMDGPIPREHDLAIKYEIKPEKFK